jgi:hypothetical protein
MYGLIKKQGEEIGLIKASVSGLSTKVARITEGIDGIAFTQEKGYGQLSSENGEALRAIKALGGEMLGEFKALGECIGSYESDRQDTVTAAQILDEYLNGAKEDRQ